MGEEIHCSCSHRRCRRRRRRRRGCCCCCCCCCWRHHHYHQLGAAAAAAAVFALGFGLDFSTESACADCTIMSVFSCRPRQVCDPKMQMCSVSRPDERELKRQLELVAVVDDQQGCSNNNNNNLATSDEGTYVDCASVRTAPLWLLPQA